MKNQKGITLASLIIYILVMIIVAGVLATIIGSFTNDVADISGTNLDIAELDKFNIYFLQEVKKTNNSVSTISEDGKQITFTLGNTYVFHQNGIYLNDIRIASNIENCTFEQVQHNGKTVVTTHININGIEYNNEFVLSNKTNIEGILNEVDYTSTN